MRFLPCPTRTSDSCTLTGSCLEPVCGTTPPAGRSPPLRPELHSNQNSDTFIKPAAVNRSAVNWSDDRLISVSHFKHTYVFLSS